MSSLSWAIIFLKWIQFRKLKHQDAEFLDIFHKDSKLDQVYQHAKDFETSSLARIFDLGYKEVVQFRQKLQKHESVSTKELIERCNLRLERVAEHNIGLQQEALQSRLNILATISSAAPFIGLFGTVLGIIDSFQSIGTSGVTSLAVVAPGISEALVATAAGLLAAIPALMAYNHFRSVSRQLSDNMRHFTLELTNRIEWILA